ncbi:MAG: response regulator [Cellvibrionaceae bacterium]|nr:response regulator [Cellvibrionaceae bacterium]
MMGTGRSIRFFVARRTAPWLLVFIVMASVVLFVFARALIHQQLAMRHDNRIDHFQASLDNTLQDLQHQVVNIATNDLIVNSIVDFQEGKNYIPLFLRSFSFSSIEKADIAITDFSGKIIFHNGINKPFTIDNMSAWQQPVLDKTQPLLWLDDSSVFIAAPIVFADAAEGAVIVRIDLVAIKEAFSIDYSDGEILYINKNNRVIYSSNSTVKTIGDEYTGEPFQGWFASQRATSQGGLILSLESAQSIYANLLIVFLFLAVASMIAIAGSVISIFLSSGLIASTLNKLLLSLDEVKKNHFTAADFANQKTPDALKTILKKYADLIKDLAATQVLSKNMKGIIHSLNEYLVVFDCEGNTKLTNSAFDRLSGEIESTCTRDFEKIIPAVLRETALTTSHPMLDFEQVYVTCPIIFDADASDQSIIRWSRSLYYSESGALEGLIFIGVDVTKTREIERDLSDKNRAIKELGWRFDFALEASAIGVWDYNVDTGELVWDERMYKLYQMDEGQFDNHYDTWIARIHPDDADRVNRHFLRCATACDDFIENFRISWPSGQWRWIASHARAVTDEQGNITRFIGTNKDISEHRKLTEELQQALVKAEESVQLKSEFLASMSHEIRTPMNGVLGMLQLLRDTPLSNKQQHYVSLARFSAESLLDLINDILDFSKVEAGKLTLDCTSYDLPDMLGDLAESMAHRAQEKGLELIFDFSCIHSTQVVGDAGRLRQILINLLSNAIKFTQAGEIILRAALTQRSEDEWQFDASVRDTGIGIPADKINRLFQSFSQVDASTTRKYGGTGLGLAIVKKLCQLMGGDVAVTSTPGEGSEFSFSIVLAASQHSSPLLPAHSLTGWRLLLVDAHPLKGRMLSRQLQQWGASVSVAEDISQAMALLTHSEEAPYKAVFIDNDMPDGSGEQLCVDMGVYRGAQAAVEAPCIIMMTSIGKRLEKPRSDELGIAFAFPKPVIPKDLLSALAVINNGGKLQDVAVNNDNSPSPVPLADSPHQPKQPHLLLVEDNVINQEVALGILDALNMTADVANNGIEALAALAKTDYDLVLMDCQMPEMDGYEATRAIRAGQVPRADITIIAMTANAMKGDKENCLAAGMDDYLTKPVDPMQLSDRLDYWLSNSPQAEKQADKTRVNEMLANDTVWDRDDFMKRVMNNETIANKLITLFKTDTPKTIAELERAVDAEQAADAGLLAHKLKGSVSNLGGIELAALAQKIEAAGKSDDLDAVKTLWPAIRPQYDKLLGVIEQANIGQQG